MILGFINVVVFFAISAGTYVFCTDPDTRIFASSYNDYAAVAGAGIIIWKLSMMEDKLDKKK